MGIYGLKFCIYDRKFRTQKNNATIHAHVHVLEFSGLYAYIVFATNYLQI